jgi:hypothetical protein
MKAKNLLLSLMAAGVVMRPRAPPVGSREFEAGSERHDARRAGKIRR